MRACLILAVCAGFAVNALAQTFEPMPRGAKAVSSASDCSKFLVADVGPFAVNLSVAYRIWTRSTPTVMTSLPALPSPLNSLKGEAMSDDGTVVAGAAYSASSFTDHAVRLVLGGSWQDLGGAPGDTTSHVYALNGDGSQAVGLTGPYGLSRPLLWTPAGGSVALSHPYPGNNASAWSVSADGSARAGIVVDPSGPSWTAWYWTSSAGYTALPLNPGERGPAVKLSRNGAWVACTVGSTASPVSPNRAFIWSPTGGREDLPLPAGATALNINGISDDGNVAACSWSSSLGGDSQAGVWRRGLGYLRLGDALRRNLPSSTFDGWVGLGGLTGISADGTVVVGEGRYLNNAKLSGWLSVLPPPCAADLGASGGLEGGDNALDNNDFIVFIDLFFRQDPLADRGSAGGLPGADGQWDNNDFIVFISQYFAGC